MVWRTVKNHEGKSLYNIQGGTWELLEPEKVALLINENPDDYLVLKKYERKVNE